MKARGRKRMPLALTHVAAARLRGKDRGGIASSPSTTITRPKLASFSISGRQTLASPLSDMSASNNRRRNTVHDLAALQLHPDGSRVGAPLVDRDGRAAKNAVRDARGQWIASDAGGGMAAVPKRPSVRMAPPGTGEGQGSESEHSDGEGVSTFPKRKRRAPRGTRARKRQKAEDRLDFVQNAEAVASSSRVTLDELGNAAGAPNEFNSNLHSLPSSDLLKAIHHHTALFYTFRGQLTNVSQQYRKLRKERRLAKLRKAAKPNGSRDSSTIPSVDGQETSGESDGSDDESASGKGQHSASARSTKSSTNQFYPERDMYKAFDGSALMAIAMLFEAHIEQLVQPRIPDDWVDPRKPVVHGGKRKRRCTKRLAKESTGPSATDTDGAAVDNDGGD